jgi:hypothetical protein
MRIEERKVYFFNELSEEAQKKAVEEDIQDGVTAGEGLECTISDFEEMLSAIGYYNIKVKYSGFYSQGNGASFSADFRRNKKNIVKYFKEEYPNENYILEIMPQFKNIKFGKDYEIEQSGIYNHENTMYCEDELLLKLSKLLAVELYKRLEEDYELFNSFDYISEMFIDGEYEFLEDGTFICRAI